MRDEEEAMSKHRTSGKLGCGFWLAFLILFIIMISSGISVKFFFIGVGIFVILIVVAIVLWEKRRKR